MKKDIDETFKTWKKEEHRYPILVAGKTGTLRSMHIYLEKYRLPVGVRISQLYFNKTLPIISLPFYAIKRYLNY
ncbi:unnamed protein product [marine sediment metagenome]|uniref:Uncharacterized protein n=1 Tax=marine sediment metagenome TaxID=412755 RepID=X1TWP3_9ZZZZ